MAPNCCCFPLALSLSMVLLFLGLVAVSESKPWGVPRPKQDSARGDPDDHTILGIDLGGKWVKAAVFQGKDVTVIEDDDNSRKEAAIVSFLTNERTKMISFERLFGRPAQRQLFKTPQRALIYTTDVLGRRFTAFAQPDAFHPYSVVAAGLNTSRAGVRVALAPGLNVLTAEEIIAMVLRHVKDVAEASPRVAPGTRLRNCVIAVRGAVATAQERAALVDAARIAGLNVIAVVSGTTASALAYAKDKPVPAGKPYRMAIVDMGATALDAAVFDISEADKEKGKGKGAQEAPAHSGAVVPRGSASDGELGGRAFAARLAALILKSAGLGTPDPSKTLYYRAYAAAEKAMEVLSVNTEAFYTLALPERDYTGRITRAEFEAAAKDLLAHVPGVLARALAAADTDAARIDDVQIVGGATRIPAVQAAILTTLGKKELHTHISADEGVCIGAAYLGAHIDPVARMYIRRKIALRDVTTLPVLLYQGSSSSSTPVTVFPVGSVVKSMKTVTLPITESTLENNSVSFVLAHPEAEDASRCSEIARFTVVLPGNFSLSAPEAAGAALKVVVTLSLAGIPAVEKASLVYSTMEGEAAVPPVDLAVAAEHLCIAPLSPTEYAAAVQHLAALDTADEEKRAVRKAKNDLEEYLLLVQRFLSDTPRASKFAKAKEVAGLQKAVASAEEWFESCPDEDSALDPVPKSDFEEKLAEVRKLGDAILLRETEAEARPHAVALLRHALVIARADLTALAEKSKDTKTFVEQFLKRCDSTEAWLDKALKKQNSRAFNEAPAFLTDEVDTKLEELRTLMIFAEYSEYSDSNYRYGAGGSGSSSDMKPTSSDSSVWTDVVSLDDASGDNRKDEL